jgi:hypothetical protein
MTYKQDRAAEKEERERETQLLIKADWKAGKAREAGKVKSATALEKLCDSIREGLCAQSDEELEEAAEGRLEHRVAPWDRHKEEERRYDD